MSLAITSLFFVSSAPFSDNLFRNAYDEPMNAGNEQNDIFHLGESNDIDVLAIANRDTKIVFH